MKELNSNIINFSETIYEGQAEQGVELDYILPDYCPEIFKILCCRLTPKIMSYNLVGDSKLSLDGSVEIKMLYLTEGSDAIHCIEQHYTYSKSVEIGKSAVPDGEDVFIKLTPHADYCNCRAVSSRRVDIRGAVSTKIRITAIKDYSMPRLPENIQIRKKELLCCANITCAEKQFSVREEIETGAQGLDCIIRSSATPKISDVRVIADKVVVKGTITVNAAYGISEAESHGCHKTEQMSADIPLSQIVDINELSDNCSCSAEIDILSCELSCSTDSGLIGCNIGAICRVTCRDDKTIQLPIDAFSTEYETDLSMGQIRLTGACSQIIKQLAVKTQLTSECGTIESVLDCNAEIYNLSCTYKPQIGLVLTGLIGTQVLCRTSEGQVCCIEKQESFECNASTDAFSEGTSITFNAICTDADYSIKADGALDVNAKIELDAVLCRNESHSVLEGITIHEDRPVPRNNDHAIKIFYPDGNDCCWSIAKQYKACVDSIMEENELADENAVLTGMVIIPAM